MTEMALFCTLLLAHLLADFPLQINLIARRKATSIPILLFHVAIHAFTLWLFFGFAWRAWPVVAGVTMAHFTVDCFKQQVAKLGCVRGFIVDQVAHLLCLALAGLAMSTFYPLGPHVILHSTLLYPLLAMSLALATMVLFWVWINSLPSERLLQSGYLQWSHQRLLTIEQCMGQSLIALLCLYLFFTSY